MDKSISQSGKCRGLNVAVALGDDAAIKWNTWNRCEGREKDREKEKKRGKIFSIHGESMKKYEVTETTALGTGIFRVQARYSIRIEEMTDRSRKLLGRFYQAAALSRYNLSYRCKRDSGKTKITTTSWKSIELTLHSQPVLKWEE